MRERVSGEMLAPGVKARDTADWETPAARATSWAVTKMRSVMGLMHGICCIGLQRLCFGNGAELQIGGCLNGLALHMYATR